MATKKQVWVGVGIAAVAAITLYSVGARKKKPNLYVKDWLPFGFNAMTVPPLGVFIKRSHIANEKLLSHELRHWQQYRERGLLPYYFGYGLELVTWGYDGMPMERDCRQGESEFAKWNYTQAVRGGQSNTVEDPGFRK
jgi:hypothetical protein